MPIEWDADAASRRCNQLFGTGAPSPPPFPHSLSTLFLIQVLQVPSARPRGQAGLRTPRASISSSAGRGLTTQHELCFWPAPPTRGSGLASRRCATRFYFHSCSHIFKLDQSSLSRDTGPQRQPFAARPWKRFGTGSTPCASLSCHSCSNHSITKLIVGRIASQFTTHLTVIP